MDIRQGLSRLWKRVVPPDASSRYFEAEPVRRGRWRLLALLLLFDVLLIAAVVLSFQESELVEEEITLTETRQVYDLEVREQVITHTTVITKVIPFGSQQ